MAKQQADLLKRRTMNFLTSFLLAIVLLSLAEALIFPLQGARRTSTFALQAVTEIASG